MADVNNAEDGMTIEEVVAQLHRGLCHPARVQAQWCHLCGPQYDAIAQVVRWHRKLEAPLGTGELADDIRMFLTKQALSPRHSANEAEVLLNRLDDQIDGSAKPLPGAEALDVLPRDVAPDPFDAFGEGDERKLARSIEQITGRVPVVIRAFEPSTKDSHPWLLLRFWMRQQDVGVTERDLDLREYHPRESVKLALRAAVRWVRLDHVGGPIA